VALNEGKVHTNVIKYVINNVTSDIDNIQLKLFIK
jgi:hypothetical protein